MYGISDKFLGFRTHSRAHHNGRSGRMASATVTPISFYLASRTYTTSAHSRNAVDSIRRVSQYIYQLPSATPFLLYHCSPFPTQIEHNRNWKWIETSQEKREKKTNNPNNGYKQIVIPRTKDRNTKREWEREREWKGKGNHHAWSNTILIACPTPTTRTRDKRQRPA